MNPEDIKKILAACPPDMLASDDPEIAAALAAAEEDDALRAFREEEAAFDRAFSAKLKAATPPADLKERILVAAANQVVKAKAEAAAPTASTVSTGGGGAEVIQFPWWKNPAVWSIAACFVVLFGISVLLPKQQDRDVARAAQLLADEGNELDSLVALAVQRTTSLGGLDFRSRDYTKVENYLQQKDKPLPVLFEGLQQQLASKNSIGCATLQFEDGSVSMICFEDDGRVFHLFVADRTKMSNCSDCPKPELRQVADRKAATWTHGDRAYVLTVGDGMDDPLPLL